MDDLYERQKVTTTSDSTASSQGGGKEGNSSPFRLVVEIVRNRRRDPQHLSRQRVHHRELGRMKHRPRCVALSVEPVAGQGVTDGGQMHANLVSPPGLQRDL